MAKKKSKKAKPKRSATDPVLKEIELRAKEYGLGPDNPVYLGMKRAAEDRRAEGIADEYQAAFFQGYETPPDLVAVLDLILSWHKSKRAGTPIDEIVNTAREHGFDDAHVQWMLDLFRGLDRVRDRMVVTSYLADPHTPLYTLQELRPQRRSGPTCAKPGRISLRRDSRR